MIQFIQITLTIFLKIISITQFSNENSALICNSNCYNPHNLITTEYIIFKIQQTVNKKAPGVDNTPNIVLKNLSHEFYKKMTILFNQLCNIGHFPRGWKHGVVVPVRKRGKDPFSAMSYRSITLLTGLSKIFEICIAEKILEHSDHHKIFPEIVKYTLAIYVNINFKTWC